MPPVKHKFVTDRIRHMEAFHEATDPVLQRFHIDDTVPRDDHRWFAIRQGGEFHLHQATPLGDSGFYRPFTPKISGFLYRPIHSSMTPEDIEGATYAWDDGTYWHFAHCSPDEQIDFAADARTFALEQFSIVIAEADVKVSEATNPPVKGAALAKVRALIAFSKAVGADVHKRVVGATLGHYHRDPHHDHRRELAIAGIDAVLEQWQETGKTSKPIRLDRQAILSTVEGVKEGLTSTHEIEWRADREKRLNDAAAASGTDPVAGYEYCYSQVATPATISGEANLPDPAWSFDQLRTGGVVRGSYVYQDAEPTPTAFLPWVIRFKRPIPEGTVAGADIGSVAWEQETAYAPSTA